MGISGKDNGQIAVFVKPPEVYDFLFQSPTALDAVVLYGRRQAGTKIKINGGLLADYPTRETWGGAFDLALGSNSFSIVAVDGVVESAPTVVNIVRVSRAGASRGTIAKVEIAGVDVSDLLEAWPQIDRRASFVSSGTEFNLIGEFAAEIGDRVKIWVSDGLVGLPSVPDFSGKIESVEYLGQNDGGFTTKITALDDLVSVLNENRSIAAIKGFSNGAVIRELLSKFGFDSVFCPDGQPYVGPRSITDQPISDILRGVLIAQGWTLRLMGDNRVVILDDFFFQKPAVNFQPDEIYDFSISRQAGDLFNVLRVAYQNAEKNPVDDDLSKNQVTRPDSDQGWGIFSNSRFVDRATISRPDDILFFMVWDTAIDWDNLAEAYIELRFTSSSARVADFRQEIALEIRPDEKLGIASFDLAPYKLTSGANFRWRAVVQPTGGGGLNSGMIGVKFTDQGFQDLEQTINEFGIVLGPRELVAEVQGEITINEIKDVPNDIWRKAEEQIETSASGFSRRWVKFEFLIEVPAVDFIARTLSSEVENGFGVFLNCELSRWNKDFSGIDWVRAVQYNDPSGPLDRLSKIFLKISGRVQSTNPISWRFKIWGRKFIDSGNWVDPNSVAGEYTDPESTGIYGQLVKRPLASAYIFNNVMAQNLATRLIVPRAIPLDNVKFSVPFTREIEKFQTISLTTDTGFSKTLIVLGVNHEETQTAIEAAELRTAFLSDPAIPEKTSLKFCRPVDLISGATLNDYVENAAGNARQLEVGTIYNPKYRGLYSVKIEGSGRVYNRIRSAVQNLVKGDRVLVGKMRDGSRYIIEKFFGEERPDQLLEPGESIDQNSGQNLVSGIDFSLDTGGSGQLAINVQPRMTFNVPVQIWEPGFKPGKIIIDLAKYANHFLYAKTRQSEIIMDLELVGDSVGQSFIVRRLRVVELLTALAFDSIRTNQNISEVLAIYDRREKDTYDILTRRGEKALEPLNLWTPPTEQEKGIYGALGRTIKLKNPLVRLDVCVVYVPSWPPGQTVEIILEPIDRPDHPNALKNEPEKTLISADGQVELQSIRSASFELQPQLQINQLLIRNTNQIELFFNLPLAADGEGKNRLSNPDTIQIVQTGAPRVYRPL